MSNRPTPVDEKLYEYILSVSASEAPILRALREETARLPSSNMQISPDQGAFLAWLVRLIGARRIVEVGVFTGYSSLSMALAMPGDGLLTACDVSEEWTMTARRYWDQAGVGERIELVLAPAERTLAWLLKKGEAGSVDMVFIDADKQNYVKYYELTRELLRSGGIMIVDNVLWNGLVSRQSDDADTEGIRALNTRMGSDPQMDAVLLTVADGLMVGRKR